MIIYGSVAPAWVLERLKKTINLVHAQLVERYKTSLVNRWICLLPSCRLTPEIKSLAREFRIELLDHRHADSPDEKIFKPLLEYRKSGGAV